MALPKLEDFRAPWETEAGGDTEIDKPKLKKYIYGLLSDKEKAQTKVTEVTTERDALKSKADEKAREGESEAERLKRENTELQEKLAKGSESSNEVLKLRVALKKGLTETQAKRLVGTTEEELEKDADELVESFGGQGAGADDEADDEAGARRHPRRITNSNDPNPNEPKPIDPDRALADGLIPRVY